MIAPSSQFFSSSLFRFVIIYAHYYNVYICPIPKERLTDILKEHKVKKVCKKKSKAKNTKFCFIKYQI